MNKITVLFPGGFKPLTGAHLELANRYARDPQVERVILLIGPKEREGITRDKTIELFNILNSNPNVEIQPTEFNSPIMAAYEYLFALPEDAIGRYAMAASTKGDDYVRAKDFVPNVDKYITIGDKKGRQMPAGIDATELSVDVDPLAYKNGEPISATVVRNALASDNYEAFRASYPNNNDAEVKNAWQILKGVQEAATFSKDWWTNELQEEIEEVFAATMNKAETQRHKKKINKLNKFLDRQGDESFVYDFDEFPKTVMGAVLTEGGAAGHMAHPYDDHFDTSHLGGFGVVRDGHVDADASDGGGRAGDDAVGSGANPVGCGGHLGVGVCEGRLAQVADLVGEFFDTRDRAARGGDLEGDLLDLGVRREGVDGGGHVVDVHGAHHLLQP